MSYEIAVVTGTRADFHLLTPLLHRIEKDPILNLHLIITGSHLSKTYGYTYNDIIKEGFSNLYKIPILNPNGEDNDVNLSLSLMIKGMNDLLKRKRIDLLIVLGDRYEILGAVLAASNFYIPIAHIHGGEVTEGALDDAIRHSITKFSHLHFTSCEQYRRRVIQLGEEPERVFNVGGLGVENILTQKLMSKEELEKDFSFHLGKFALVTFHPVTLEMDTEEQQTIDMLEALLSFPKLNLVITKSNADRGGIKINHVIDAYTRNYPNRIYSEFSLGMIRYLSAMKYSAFVIGNSSSGILEAPSFHIPTVNIGDRQKGRVQSISVINCSPEKNDISNAIKKALDKNFVDSLANLESPYGNGNTSYKIYSIIKEHLKKGINLKKHFFDL